MAILNQREYDNVDNLGGDEIFVLRELSLGLSKAAIGKHLEKKSDRDTGRNVDEILGALVEKLEVRDKPTHEKQLHAAAKLYVDYSDMNRDGIAPIVVNGSKGDAVKAGDAKRSITNGNDAQESQKPAVSAPPTSVPAPVCRLDAEFATPVSIKVENQGTGRPLKVPLSRLLRYEGQPRRYFNKVEIAELADDIQLNEQETPCRVFPTPGKPDYFTFIGGGRRERAFHLIAQRTRTDPLVDCVLGTVRDARDHYRKAFRDNIKRKDYIPRDEADAYLHMYNDSPLPTHEERVLELMREAGKSRKHIENYLLVAGLPEEVKALMNPDLLDKQLVYLIAFEIARSTTDEKLRIELAKGTSQKCMGLPQARLFIRQKTGHSNYGGSGRPRVAADEYRAFKEVLTGMQARLARVKEDWDVEGVYKARPKSTTDRERDAAMIKEMIAQLRELLGKVEGNTPKPARA